MSLQGSPIEENDPSVPKMINGELKCGEDYTLKLSDAYQKTVEGIKNKNLGKKKKISKSTSGHIAGLTIFGIIFILTSPEMFVFFNENIEVLYYKLFWKGIKGIHWVKPSKWGALSIVSCIIACVFAWQVAENVRKDKKSNDPDPEPIPEPKEGDYYCEKITVEAKGVSSGGFSSRGGRGRGGRG